MERMTKHTLVTAICTECKEEQRYIDTTLITRDEQHEEYRSIIPCDTCAGTKFRYREIEYLEVVQT